MASLAVATPVVAQSPAVDASTEQTTRFAPGVVTVIPPSPMPEETYDGPLVLEEFISAHPEIAWTAPEHPDGSPHFDPKTRTLLDMARDVTLRREIYCFEFAFKPLRQIVADLPQPDGTTARRLVMYMVYRVRYVGGDLNPKTQIEAGRVGVSGIRRVHYGSRRFFPGFRLVNEETEAELLDQVLPAVTPRIQRREKITARLHNSVEISTTPIPYSDGNADDGVWGVATWTDFDPNIDFLSVDVFGLTNAFEVDGTGMDSPYRRKALELFFYRPGDTVDPTEDRIRFGVPAYTDAGDRDYVLKQYGLEEKRDYRWVFKP